MTLLILDPPVISEGFPLHDEHHKTSEISFFVRLDMIRFHAHSPPHMPACYARLCGSALVIMMIATRIKTSKGSFGTESVAILYVSTCSVNILQAPGKFDPAHEL